MLKGYTSKLLHVDLSTGSITDQPLNTDYAMAFVGGSGIASRYIYDMVSENTDPLGPENPLLFMTGPLTGTNTPSCGRYTVCARSPLTGFWGEANSGGNFGPSLKFAGYDGVIIVGTSPRPVYLEINDKYTGLRDASQIWGQDSYRTQEMIKGEINQPRASVACIGIAGEKISKIAAIMNDHGRAAGRTGLGAVMGSKNLKAVAVSGGDKPEIADGDAFLEATREAYTCLKNDMSAQMFRLGGTAMYTDIGMLYGDIPVRYYTQGNFDVSNINGAALEETILTGAAACYRCPIACGRRIKLEKYGISEADGPEYETVASLGTMLLIDNIQDVGYVGHLCNCYGLDTISTGATIAFAISLFEKGILGVLDTDGLELRWGDVNAVITLIERLTHREGFGDILADGSLALAKRYGVEDLAVQVKGLEVPMHDPRAFSGMAVTYATSPRGACHLNSDFFYMEMGVEVPELGIIASPATEWKESSKEKAIMAVRHQNWRGIFDALVLCKFANLPSGLITRLFYAVTGRHITLQELYKIGECIFTMKRMVNLKLGLTPEDDRLPSLLLKPLPDGGAAGNVPNIDLMLDEYYRFRIWDKTTGRPSSEKLDELGLHLTSS